MIESTFPSGRYNGIRANIYRYEIGWKIRITQRRPYNSCKSNEKDYLDFSKKHTILLKIFQKQTRIPLLNEKSRTFYEIISVELNENIYAASLIWRKYHIIKLWRIKITVSGTKYQSRWAVLAFNPAWVRFFPSRCHCFNSRTKLINMFRMHRIEGNCNLYQLMGE